MIQLIYISIHAPTRGATGLKVISVRLRFLFQSTLPREERRSLCEIDTKIVIFQSTLPREERRAILGISTNNYKFQSTLPREERPQQLVIMIKPLNFNPRSHERSDSNIAQKICLFLYNTDNKYIIR